MNIASILSENTAGMSSFEKAAMDYAPKITLSGQAVYYSNPTDYITLNVSLQNWSLEVG